MPQKRRVTLLRSIIIVKISSRIIYRLRLVLLLKLAWRNIFRNRRRTAVIILTIGIGLWGLAVSSAFWDGMILQMIENAVGSETGQLKIQHPEFQDNMHIKNHIKDSSRSEELLANDPRVKLYARRLKSRGLIRSAEKSAMLLFSGINPLR